MGRDQDPGLIAGTQERKGLGERHTRIVPIALHDQRIDDARGAPKMLQQPSCVLPHHLGRGAHPRPSHRISVRHGRQLTAQGVGQVGERRQQDIVGKNQQVSDGHAVALAFSSGARASSHGHPRRPMTRDAWRSARLARNIPGPEAPGPARSRAGA